MIAPLDKVEEFLGKTSVYDVGCEGIGFTCMYSLWAALLPQVLVGLVSVKDVPDDWSVFYFLVYDSFDLVLDSFKIVFAFDSARLKFLLVFILSNTILLIEFRLFEFGM